jgi:hypothetical protein
MLPDRPVAKGLMNDTSSSSSDELSWSDRSFFGKDECDMLLITVTTRRLVCSDAVIFKYGIYEYEYSMKTDFR